MRPSLRSLLAVVPFVAACVSTGRHAPSRALPKAGPCVGRVLKLPVVSSHCRSGWRRMYKPPPGLKIYVEPSLVTVPSDRTARATLVMKNTTARPMRLVFATGCGIFSTAILDAKGCRADEVGSCLLCGLCGSGSPYRVILLPGGRLGAGITVTAKVMRWVVRGKACKRARPTPLAPGRYVLRVNTPFSDMVGGKRWHRRTRTVETPLLVTGQVP